MRNSWFVIAALLLAACSDDHPSTSSSTVTEAMRVEYPEFASRFATALTEGEYDAAHEMLSSDMQQDLTAAELGGQFEAMVEYGESPARVDGFTETLDSWPDKKPDDVGWVYVSISGDDFGEAVAVVVSADDSGMSISSIEWGRP